MKKISKFELTPHTETVSRLLALFTAIFLCNLWDFSLPHHNRVASTFDPKSPQNQIFKFSHLKQSKNFIPWIQHPLSLKLLQYDGNYHQCTSLTKHYLTFQRQHTTGTSNPKIVIMPFWTFCSENWKMFYVYSLRIWAFFLLAQNTTDHWPKKVVPKTWLQMVHQIFACDTCRWYEEGPKICGFCPEKRSPSGAICMPTLMWTVNVPMNANNSKICKTEQMSQKWIQNWKLLQCSAVMRGTKKFSLTQSPPGLLHPHWDCFPGHCLHQTRFPDHGLLGLWGDDALQSTPHWPLQISSSRLVENKAVANSSLGSNPSQDFQDCSFHGLKIGVAHSSWK